MGEVETRIDMSDLARIFISRASKTPVTGLIVLGRASR